MSADPIHECAAAALRGGLIVFPTDTVYGLGARPDDPAATDRVFEAKARPRGLSLPVLAASAAAARHLGAFDERAERLAAAAWPGPLTIVVPRSAESRGWALGNAGGSIALRVPAHPLALAILALAGPLAVTSANRSGEPPAEACEDLERLFGEVADVIVCGPQRESGRASTIVDLTGPEPQVTRVGDLTADDVRRLLSATGPLLHSGPFSR